MANSFKVKTLLIWRYYISATPAIIYNYVTATLRCGSVLNDLDQQWDCIVKPYFIIMGIIKYT